MNILFTLGVTPLITAIFSLLVRRSALSRCIVAALCWVQMMVVLWLCWPILIGVQKYISSTDDFSIDRLGASFLVLTTLIGACALSHAKSFFEMEETISPTYKPYHEQIFYACSSVFLLAMSVVFVCDNLGILWVCIEATTLSTAALVYFSRTKHSLEATWKYLIICSVGIAFALLGTILIFSSSQHGGLPIGSLNFKELMAHATSLQYPLLRLGYIFCIVGFGTKAGVFPLHSWLPDAHSEAPAPASAMLSGALLNCALFPIWRLTQLVVEAHHEQLACTIPLVLGSITALAASLILIHQHGIKRLWAYSSIENVGIMLIAIGLGSGLLFFLQAFNHSVCKAALFLLSGNIIQATGKKSLADIKGVLNLSPVWGIALGLAAVGVTGAPPFGSFVSELLILIESANRGYWWVVVGLTVALLISFVAVSIHLTGILFGTARKEAIGFKPIATSCIPFLLIACAIAAGITSIPLCLVNFK